MAEAMLCDQPGLFDDINQCESIVVFVEKNKDNKKIKELYEAWEDICSSLQINITYVRWKLDSWFQECYLAWKEMQRLSSEVSPEMAQERREKLFEQFKTQIEEVTLRVKDDFIIKLKIEKAKDEIMRNYSHNQEDWIDKAVECVEKENQLMADFKKVKLQEEKAEASQVIEKELAKAKVLEKDISKCIEKMKNEVTNWNQHFSKKEESQQNLSRLKGFLGSIPKNGVVSELKQLESTIKDCDVHMNKSQDQISLDHKEVIGKFVDLQNLLTELVNELVRCVLAWKEDYKLQYVELAATPNLTRIAPWCAQAGRLIYDLINVNLTSWTNILSNLECDDNDLIDFKHNFCELLAFLLQSTFVVTEQESCIIKVDKKYLPKFVVRILAAENFPERNETIMASFAFEDDINTCCWDNNLDHTALEKKIKERAVHLMARSFKFENGKKKDKNEACFQTLHFKEKFSRQGIQTGKQVHEEKSRIIFTTNIQGQEYWTMSLPLVVTTGANQGCLSQASVMWQCYSTDIYSVPIAECNPLPWCQVAKMLQAKMQKLCSTRKLSSENINHLKRRLFGRSDVPDDEMVTLKMFCFDKLVKTDVTDDISQLTFSFWKWFIGIYNLLDKYLLNFWKDGSIIGFISKEEAKEKLKRCKNGRSGIFLLRFSDHNITDSQGVKSVFGHLTACVLIIKEELDGRKKKKIYDMDVAGHKKLKEKNLANILKETQEAKSGKIYQYLYPGEKTREETFDTYCDKDAVVTGYTGTRDAFVVHLDQQLAALEISCGKHTRSPSVDSGIDTSSPINNVLTLSGYTDSAAKVKKQRISVKHPTIAMMLQQDNSSKMEVKSDLSISPRDNQFTVQSPAYSDQSSCYLGSSPNPSAMSPDPATAPSPTNSTQSQSLDDASFTISTDLSEFQQPSMSEMELPKCVSLPTVIDDAVPVNGKPSKWNMGPVSDTSGYGTISSGYNSTFTTTQTSQGNGYGITNMIIEDDSGQMISFETGSTEVIVQQLSGHSSLESSGSSHSVVTDSQEGAKISPAQSEKFCMVQTTNNGFKEPVTSTVSDQQEILICQSSTPELAQVMTLINTLPPDMLKLLQNYMDQNVSPGLNCDNEHMLTVVGPVPVCPVVTTSCTPILTSSGSITDAFNFSQKEIAEVQEMNSGTIDTSVFDTSSGGMPT